MKIQRIDPETVRLGWLAGLLAAAVLLSACSGSTATVVTVATSTPVTVPATAAPSATAAASATAAVSATAAASATAPVPAVTATTAAAVSTATGSPAGGANSPGPVGDAAAKQAVVNALQAFQKAGPYRVDSTITANGKTEQMTSEVVPPDRYHVKMPTMEVLVVGSKTYMKQGDKWVAFPIDIGSIISGLTSTTNQEMINGMSDFRVVGPDVVSGVPVTVFQYAVNFGTGSSALNTTNKMWVDIARGLPVRQEITGSAGGVQSTTVQIITYDPNITINPPPQ